jgi:hypothetical protein
LPASLAADLAASGATFAVSKREPSGALVELNRFSFRAEQCIESVSLLGFVTCSDPRTKSEARFLLPEEETQPVKLEVSVAGRSLASQPVPAETPLFVSVAIGRAPNRWSEAARCRGSGSAVLCGD